jgi:DNA-directed RNA polymerase specialized sigma24 family protein
MALATKKTGRTAMIPNRENDHATSKLMIGKYESFLRKLGTCLGLKETEVAEHVQNIIYHASRQHEDAGHRFTLRIWLSKMMVHKCIFLISRHLFGEPDNYEKRKASSHQDIPLSFWVVFKLNNFGFSENEIAEILNTTGVQVRSRYLKAVAIMRRHEKEN